mmetsp:Transcript_11971/g.38548  ORF Transcript_11971/g.38548 Transcript_11971/m.38548 type:complete len:247 (+) Transcript_11971:651-1391(+)
MAKPFASGELYGVEGGVSLDLASLHPAAAATVRRRSASATAACLGSAVGRCAGGEPWRPAVHLRPDHCHLGAVQRVLSLRRCAPLLLHLGLGAPAQDAVRREAHRHCHPKIAALPLLEPRGRQLLRCSSGAAAAATCGGGGGRAAVWGRWAAGGDGGDAVAGSERCSGEVPRTSAHRRRAGGGDALLAFRLLRLHGDAGAGEGRHIGGPALESVIATEELGRPAGGAARPSAAAFRRVGAALRLGR